jgi:hypothetical protein
MRSCTTWIAAFIAFTLIASLSFAAKTSRELVYDSFTVSLNTKSITYYEGSLKGGTAVLVGDRAAYWVKDGKLYAANGVAMTWSKNLGIIRRADNTFE